MAILVGADPEVFVKQGRSWVCAHGLVPGDKRAPHKVKNGAVQVDGMALEFNIDPTATKQGFRNNINSVLATLQDMVPKHKVEAVASITFSDEVMKAAPEEAKILGCDPDFNAYTRKENPAPKDPGNLRSAGGHVHVGWTTGADTQDWFHFESCCELVRGLDVLLALPSLFLDKDEKRRKIYGKAGAMRIKPYGVEYRTLSNFWIKSPKTIDWVWDSVDAAVKHLKKRAKEGKGGIWDHWGEGASIRRVIDSRLYKDYRYHYTSEEGVSKRIQYLAARFGDDEDQKLFKNFTPEYWAELKEALDNAG